MWANAQRDGRPAEYRWRPLFNAARGQAFQDLGNEGNVITFHNAQLFRFGLGGVVFWQCV